MTFLREVDMSLLKLGDLHSSAIVFVFVFLFSQNAWQLKASPDCTCRQVDRCGRAGLEAAPPCPGAP